jgi:hypothetical protein
MWMSTESVILDVTNKALKFTVGTTAFITYDSYNIMHKSGLFNDPFSGYYELTVWYVQNLFLINLLKPSGNFTYHQF